MSETLSLYEVRRRINELGLPDSYLTSVKEIKYISGEIICVEFDSIFTLEQQSKNEKIESENLFLKQELQNLKKEIEEGAAQSEEIQELKTQMEAEMQKWEAFARLCLENMTPGRKKMIEKQIIAMNKFITEKNINVMSF